MPSLGIVFGTMLCGMAIAWPSVAGSGVAGGEKAGRVSSGLLALYDFVSQGTSAVVEDHAGGGEPLNLAITDSNAVRHSDEGLEVTRKTLIRAEKPASRLSEAIRRSGAVTIEAWIRPAKVDQTGPARIISLSSNPNERNFTLGQDGDKFEVRFRSTATSLNGIPAVSSKAKSVSTGRIHVVYTRDRTGRSRLYVDGQLNAEMTIAGATSNWDAGYPFALANEQTGDRPWLGTYRLVAIYGRDLSASEVAQNFEAGALAGKDTASLAQNNRGARTFETQIAPLLSKHCLECHDSTTKKGRLDLSRRSTALAGGQSGPVIVPGKAADSSLWQLVMADEMPHERAPLTSGEKRLLEQWLEVGAPWSLERIDPAVYAHGSGASQIFVQRLTVSEYIETVRGALGVDISNEATELLPPDLAADGFRNTAYNLTVDLAHVEAYARLAEIIVDRIDVKSLARKHTKSRELSDENVTKVVEPVGRRLLRGPLSKTELANYCGISTTVAGSGGNLDEAIRFILEAMLQSPRFIYRIETQLGDGLAWPVAPYELASRISYIVWGGPPDDELLKAAEKGLLDRPGVEAQAKRMLQDRRAVERSRQFMAEWLDLSRLENLRPGRERFPQWDGNLAAEMRHETLAFFEEVVWKQNRPMSDLLNARVTFVTPRLAKHYGLPWDKESEGNSAVRYDLATVPGRTGLLTHGSVATIGGDHASMVTRGLFVMHELLRGVVRDPPPCVDTTPVPSKPGLTQRMVAESRVADKKCTGCHSKFEPLAFGLERIDGVGAYREIDEYGNKLRDDGQILFPGEEKPVPYQSMAEFADLLAKSDRVRESITWKVTQFALGRPLGAEDASIVADIHREAQANGGTYSSLIVAIVASDLVRMTRSELSADQLLREKEKSQ